MKILVCHNYYQQPGGEDRVMADECWLLESHGHQVVRFTKHNDDIERMGRLQLAGKTLCNREVYDALRRRIRAERPDVLHATNIFPLISPAAYFAARDEGVPVVQSLHNYRLICPKATLVRNGRVCEKCVGKSVYWPGVVHACYRESRAATSVVVAMLAKHWNNGTWREAVNQYIAPTEFARAKLIEGGLPAEKLVVKPNFVRNVPTPGEGSGDYAVFVGRLSPEKGIDTLLSAWRRLDGRVPLRIIGDGPLVEQVRGAARRDSSIRWLGPKPHAEVLETIGDARMLVFPSNCYETFGLSMVESLAKGTPVVASRHGAMRELIDDGRTGLTFKPANADDLAAKVRQLHADPSTLAHMRVEARREFEEKYTPEINYRMLMEIYQQVLAKRNSDTQPSFVNNTKELVTTAISTNN